MITFFNMQRIIVWSLLVVISNIATWNSLTLPDKGFTVPKYPIGINILARISVTDIMPPIRVAISISMRGEDVLLYKFQAKYIFFYLTSSAVKHSGPFRLILFDSVFSVFSLLQASAEAIQLRSVTFLAGTLVKVMAINLIEQWMIDGEWIELIGE